MREYPSMNRFLVRLILVCILIVGLTKFAFADWKSDIGYNDLQDELGTALSTGTGVNVTQVEASYGKPDPNNAEFSGKTFIDKSPSQQVTGHATTVALYFYGNSSSIAPGITNIDSYDAGYWVGIKFLGSVNGPLISSSRVGNHSWVGNLNVTASVTTLARLDWVIGRDEYINVVGMNNGGTTYPLLGSSFNAISVGLSNGSAAHGSYALVTTPTTPYAPGERTKPDIVGPADLTSWATPMVSSAAALLVGAGHQDGNTLSTDQLVKFTTTRNGDTIYNSERSEVIKASLMAGASRISPNLSSYTVNTPNGLNNVLGSGELNIYNSYHIIAAGEQNSQEDLSGNFGEISYAGFDYDPEFGGLSSSNRTASYFFKAITSGSLSASLVWNLKIAGGDTTFDTTATLYNLSLHLYDTTTQEEVASSNSSLDNTQNIWQATLTANHNYMLQVKAETPSNFLWDYSLAWDIKAIDNNPQPILYGDISGDGTISAYDASLAAQYTVGLVTLAEAQIQAADVTGDGGVSAYDASLIAQRAIGLIDIFPVEG